MITSQLRNWVADRVPTCSHVRFNRLTAGLFNAETIATVDEKFCMDRQRYNNHEIRYCEREM